MRIIYLGGLASGLDSMSLLGLLKVGNDKLQDIIVIHCYLPACLTTYSDGLREITNGDSIDCSPTMEKFRRPSTCLQSA